MAQGDFYTFEDDIAELSPFEVSSVNSGQYDPRYRGGSGANSPIKLRKRADLVTLSLTVSSSDKNPEKRILNLKNAFELVQNKADQNDQILFKSGFVALPMVSGSFFASKGKSADEVSSFDMFLIAKMGETDTIFERMEVLNRFIEDIDFANDVDVYFKSSGIALLKPQQYRKELIQRIGEEFEFLKQTFGDDIQITVTGLDKKVQVTQVDDINLEIFLPYQMAIQTNKSD